MIINHVFSDTHSNIGIGERELKHPESAMSIFINGNTEDAGVFFKKLMAWKGEQEV